MQQPTPSDEQQREIDVTPDWHEEYDLVVVGAGAGGLTAALVGAHHRLRVLLVEKTGFVGGTTARSGGALWLPDSPQARSYRQHDDAEEAHRYLDALVGDRSPRELREAYVEAAPRMVEYLDRHSEVRFELAPAELDYRMELPGASHGGRVLRPLPFDGRRLGRQFERIAPPLPELMLLGKLMVTRAEVSRLLAWPSPSALTLATRLLARYAIDRVRYSRGTRLVLGNALVARLFHSVLAQDVPIRFGAIARDLVVRSRRVVGVSLEHDGDPIAIRALRGVVLAGGGFPADASLRSRLLPAPTAPFTAAYEACIGETLSLAERAGAAFQGSEDNALWFPSSTMSRTDGSTAVFPHIVLDRAKPGLVAVDARGRRFVDEAVSYHEFVRAMYRAHRSGCPSIPTHLVCDRRFLWRYGLGMVRPRTHRLRRFLESKYLWCAHSIEELAGRLAIDSAGLRETIERHNRFARSGVDEDFGKGANAYDRSNGDAAHRPNPCLGPIDT
ncbi:MAG TPA: FAD-dependent oxidoreductase, partial [Casimicrobiaceae bacterium]|nr:FAD-dependent oxidoreductase [Casimicrobiaceae bacterium]